jgi:hypothetical protein
VSVHLGIDTTLDTATSFASNRFAVDTVWQTVTLSTSDFWTRGPLLLQRGIGVKQVNFYGFLPGTFHVDWIRVSATEGN